MTIEEAMVLMLQEADRRAAALGIEPAKRRLELWQTWREGWPHPTGYEVAPRAYQPAASGGQISPGH